MQLETASVVGIPTKTTWSSAVQVKIGDNTLFGVVSVSGDDRAPTEGRRFIRFFESLEVADTAGFYQALEAQLTAWDREIELSFSLAFGSLPQVLLLTHGFGSLALLREHQPRWLIAGEQERHVLEGHLRSGDRLILATRELSHILPPLDVMAHDSPDDVVARLFTRVQPQSGAAGLIVSISEVADTASVPTMHGSPHQDESAREPTVQAMGSGPAHLISPEKLQQGILATQSEQSKRIQEVLTQKRWSWLSEGPARQRKRFITLGIIGAVIVIALLGLSVTRTAAQRQEYAAVITPLENMFAEAKALPEDQKQQQRAQVQSLLERVQATRVKHRRNTAALTDLRLEIEKYSQEISGQKEVVNLPVYYDFRLIAADFLAQRAKRSDTMSVFLDPGSRRVISLVTDSKASEIVALAGLDQAQDIALSELSVFILDGKVIKQGSVRGGSVQPIAELKDAQEPTQLEVFGESLYVLDKAAQQIWRAPLSAEATASGWVRSARGVPFANLTDMAIDGEIWLGDSSGEIYRFVRGERQSFAPSNLDVAFRSSLILAAQPEGKSLVVVEPDQKRLVVLDKSGVYQMQVTSEQFGAATDLYLSDDETTAFVVAGSVVYQVPLKATVIEPAAE